MNQSTWRREKTLNAIMTLNSTRVRKDRHLFVFTLIEIVLVAANTSEGGGAGLSLRSLVVFVCDAAPDLVKRAEYLPITTGHPHQKLYASNQVVPAARGYGKNLKMLPTLKFIDIKVAEKLWSAD